MGFFSPPTWFKVYEVPVKIHVSLPVALLLLFLLSPPELWFLLGCLVPLTLASTLLHEIGHAIIARDRGHPASSIIFTPLGGFTRMTGLPFAPADEMQIALGGPLVSLALALAGAGLWALGLATKLPFLLHLGGWVGVVNTLYLVFNLLPIYPLDGGRMLKAWLTPRKGAVETMRLMAFIGRSIGIGLGLWAAASFNPLLLALALMIWLLSEAEYRVVVQRERLRGTEGDFDARQQTAENEFKVGPPPYATKSDRAAKEGGPGQSIRVLIREFKNCRFEYR